MTDYKVGDKVWFVPDGYLIAIECVIIEIDDYFRKKEPQAYLFYDLDEPVGHNVSVTELHKTKELALEELTQRYKELLEDCVEDLIENANELSKQIFPSKAVTTLERYRKGRINFIVSTWEDCQDHEQSFIKRSWYLKLSVKEYGKEWFNVENING